MLFIFEIAIWNFIALIKLHKMGVESGKCLIVSAAKVVTTDAEGIFSDAEAIFSVAKTIFSEGKALATDAMTIYSGVLRHFSVKGRLVLASIAVVKDKTGKLNA